MKKGLVALAVFLLVMFPSLASAAKGVVVYYKSGCDYYIVETNLGYDLLEWYGGYDPNVGDTLVGGYETYGMQKIYDLSADSDTTVWVEEFWLSKENVMEQYFDKCS